ncbi:hypothetical protein BDZ89DRAFT_708094 [Hymenopellis radicata]|nr:hypothetical protein BDZ89DRAFT_708094 [Hymenopellis radicata]
MAGEVGSLENHARDLPPPSTPSMFGASVSSTPQPASMMTRGVKRLASNSVSSLTGPSLLSMGLEEPKNKRHKTVQDCMRKLIKRRAELAAKNSGRKASNVHETHAQYAKLPFKTPAELVRVKMEKDKNELHAKQQAQQAQAAMANRKGVAVPATANGQQQPAQQPPQPQQVSNGQTVPSQAPAPVQAQVATQVPAQPKPVASAQQPTSIPIRNQVNISQQRMATPHISNRPSPQQMLRNQPQMPQQGLPSHSQLTQQQIQNAIAHLQAQTAAAQAAAATQGANSLPVGNGTTASMSPPFGARDSTSSPAHTSPPLTSASATGNVNSPRPASTQPRATPGHYYMSNVGYTPEQLQMLSMRYQAQHQHMQQAAQQAQQAQQGQQQQQQQQAQQAPQQ